MAIVINGSTGITATESSSVLGDNAIETADIAANAVTAAKLASTLDLTGKTVTLPAGVGGKVLQVVSAATTTNTSTTSASYVAATNLTASITPSSTSNKILILVNMNLYGSANTTEGAITIYRNGSDLTGGSGFADMYTGSSDYILQAPMMYLDSPSSTSSVTYAVYLKRTQGAGTLQTPLRGTTNTITLLEIAA